MELSHEQSAYRRYAHVYDFFFGSIFEQGRRQALALANEREAPRILEVGVGTGLSLARYREDARVIGIDVSEEMLRIAKKRVEEESLSQVEAVLSMDAEALDFPDDSFDVVSAMYVVSVTPNPAKAMAEMARVCKPDGEIIVVNHFASPSGPFRWLERALSPLSGWMGFRPNMEFTELPTPEGFRLCENRRINLFGYWRLLRYRMEGAASDGGASSTQ